MGAAPPPPGYASSEEKTWALVAHFGGAAGMFLFGAVFGWVAPLIAMLAKGNQSATVRAHAVNALNFQITWSIVAAVGWVLACIVIGFIPVLLAYAMGIIFGIIAGLKANEGQIYSYPASLKLVK
jgi:Uncharacterized protein conserved in bacteria